MKKFTALALLALVCVAAGCKEKSPGDKLGTAVDGAAGKANDAVKDAKEAMPK